MTKTGIERVVVLNSIARAVITSRLGTHEEHVFTCRGKPVGKLRNSARRRAWERAGLPIEAGILKVCTICGTRSGGDCEVQAYRRKRCRK